jgi:peptidoglycan/xylan/chitin deacetylase (PgdA/CDA1 family)
MTIQWSKTLLLWDPDDPRLFGLDPNDFSDLGINTLMTRYDFMGRDPGLLPSIRSTGAEALIFTRNDDMEGSPPLAWLLGKLRMGYTTLSAIDRVDQVSQTKQCMYDLLNGKAELEIPDPIGSTPVTRNSQGSFSLIFDLEQLGGARFGMPRLLPMLESHQIRATFFITGFIAETYPGLIGRIVRGGHEIAVHGTMHESLHDRPLTEQIERVREAKVNLETFGTVSGANYIFRMDQDSPEALLRAGLRYLVLFRKVLFHRTRYMEQSCKVRPLRTPAGDLTLVPVSVETYAMSRSMVRAMIDRAWRTSIKEDVNHISVLMHPFKDGGLGRLNTTEWVIRYLTRDLELKGVPVSEVAHTEQADSQAVEILYRWDNNEPSTRPDTPGNHPIPNWWAPILYHSRRTERLCDGLNESGQPAVLSTTPPDAAKRICVYPDRWENGHLEVRLDPILGAHEEIRSVRDALQKEGSIQISPSSVLRDIWRYIFFHFPRTWSDIRELVPRIWPKIAGTITAKDRE